MLNTSIFTFSQYQATKSLIHNHNLPIQHEHNSTSPKCANTTPTPSRANTSPLRSPASANPLASSRSPAPRGRYGRLSVSTTLARSA
ncbi:hypothetical protein BDP81DRAFT_413109 [Colletotrichum phormii]|uniref:Uncharacterized protein n=1 Tax=Colletotrichum phormii TaxID=359342 RepID=A0AAJ0ENK0_9PEZI|nr:uncharacterized protein BDP81DRAFT_413109 [Colletotrichum phormii]KAK1655654.1 hypothetical protein BDP81DRAFT_413109 [Colletotrichum phormii]